MIHNKSTRYALYAAVEMASAPPDSYVTAAAVAERYRIPSTVLAKVFQQLVRAGIAAGTRGSGGGYQLTRHPSAITMLDVIDVFEPTRVTERCILQVLGERSCPDADTCRIRRVLDEVQEQVRSTYASITLETLAWGGRMPGLALIDAERGTYGPDHGREGAAAPNDWTEEVR